MPLKEVDRVEILTILDNNIDLLLPGAQNVQRVRDKGLAVLTGCGHAGVINTIQHSQQLTSVKEIAAVMGGFHLSGLFFEQAIEPTVAALKQIDPA